MNRVQRVTAAAALVFVGGAGALQACEKAPQDLPEGLSLTTVADLKKEGFVVLMDNDVTVLTPRCEGDTVTFLSAPNALLSELYNRNDVPGVILMGGHMVPEGPEKCVTYDVQQESALIESGVLSFVGRKRETEVSFFVPDYLDGTKACGTIVFTPKKP